MGECERMDKVMVSIICTAYNQEKYIAQALDSFIDQKTTFDFEILVHDDCSTDLTGEIIKDYSRKYPELVRAFLESENQYSQGISIMRKILIPEARGKYMALCEGDDYWTDTYKLQKQVEYMESHPECTLCIHSSEIVDTKGDRIQVIAPRCESGIILTDDVIRGGGGFIATNSILAPMKLAKNTPYYFDIQSLDYVWQMYFASQGTTFYFSDIMSAYRKGVDGSWSSRTETNKDATVCFEEKKRKVLSAFNEDTNKMFDNAVRYRMNESLFSQYMWTGDKSLKKNEGVIEFQSQISWYKYLHIYFRIHFPKLFRMIQKIRAQKGKKQQKQNKI